MAPVSKFFYSSTGEHGSGSELAVVVVLGFVILAAILGASFGVWLALG